MGCGASLRSEPDIENPRAIVPKDLNIPELIIYHGIKDNPTQFATNLIKYLKEDCELQVRMIGLEEFKEEVFVEQKIVVFLLVIYEEDLMQTLSSFFDWLENEPKEVNIHYAIFGYSNTIFKNTLRVTIKAIENKLFKCKASKFSETAILNEESNLQEIFTQWQYKLIQDLILMYRTDCIKKENVSKFELEYTDKIAINASDYSINARQYLLASKLLFNI